MPKCALRLHAVLSRKYLDRYWRDLDELLINKALPDNMPERFVSGRDAWVIQTLLELNAHNESDAEFSYGSRCLDGRINLLHNDDYGSKSAHWRGTVIVARADRPPVYGADSVIVQNPMASQAGAHRYIPHWPQPGLLPRLVVPESGRQWRVVYFGRTGAFPASFRSESLLNEAHRRGFCIEFRENGWWDYRDVDVAISFRDMPYSDLLAKPASKLVNAWIAGVPMISDGEPAFAALHKGEFDYLQASSPLQLLECLERLRDDSSVYQLMTENGRQRAQNFCRATLRSAWFDYLRGIKSHHSLVQRLWKRGKVAVTMMGHTIGGYS